MTCSTTGSEEAVSKDPVVGVTAHPGDRLALTLPAGWAFLRWEGSDRPAAGEGPRARPPVDVAGLPSRIEVPVPDRQGDSIAAYSLWIVITDGRVVGLLEYLVRVGVS